MTLVERPIVAEFVPTPVSETVCGLLLALSEITRLAVRVPVAEGVKVMPMVHASPGGTLDPQSFDCPKSDEFVPFPKMLVMVRAVLWLLVRITFCVALVVPIACGPECRLVGATVSLTEDGRMKVQTRVCHTGLPVPIWFVVKYSFTYQKAHPPTGSTVMLVYSPPL